MKIGVVILNYLAYKETINCVQSFLKQDYGENDYFISIVDNASPNASFEMLKAEYADSQKISVVRSEKNIGFAKGNNLGYAEILKHFKPDFVIVSNDDILLKQPGLAAWIMDMYARYDFAVLGPSIHAVLMGAYQNPMDNYTKDLGTIRRYLVSLSVSLVLDVFKLWFNVRAAGEVRHTVNADNARSYSKDLTLHGSFLIFSPTYFSHFREPFYPETFLYHEEHFLKLRCDRERLVMLYSPDYEVDHLVSVSTTMSSANVNKRRLRRHKYLLQSLLKYYRVLKAGKE